MSDIGDVIIRVNSLEAADRFFVEIAQLNRIPPSDNSRRVYQTSTNKKINVFLEQNAVVLTRKHAVEIRIDDLQQAVQRYETQQAELNAENDIAAPITAFTLSSSGGQITAIAADFGQCNVRLTQQ